jgi:hypothetical protein
MQLPTANMALRKALDLKLSPQEHRAKVQELRQAYSHTITFIRYREMDLSCVPYALGLSENRLYRSVARWTLDIFGSGNDVYAGTKFMTWLLQGYLQELAKPHAGCLVCYIANGEWKHIGIYGTDSRVTSKWGPLPLYEHRLEEVPAAYGCELRFFEKPSPEDAVTLFRQFAVVEEDLSEDDFKEALEYCCECWTDEALT